MTSSTRGAGWCACLTAAAAVHIVLFYGGLALWLQSGASLHAPGAAGLLAAPCGDGPGQSVSCFGPIDAVYTWVNGSDPAWRAEYAAFAWQEGRVAKVAEHSEFKRYRDSDELRYSLRSLERYAPWIRHVFIVTNGQVPAWLDRSNPRVSVVAHAQIFPDPSVLPTFSSPAIEAHIHRIPGLARRFLYFNDDVFLGAPVAPDDFFTYSRGQRVFPAWTVPPCRPGCATSWRGDGLCDLQCNTTECGFDNGDCLSPHAVVGTPYAGPGLGIDYSSLPRNHAADEALPRGGDAGAGSGGSNPWARAALHCSPDCPIDWVGDHSCDQACMTPGCGFDGGDCGMHHVWQGLYGASLPADAAERERGNEVTLSVPPDAPAAYVNFSRALPGKVVDASHDNTLFAPGAVIAKHVLVLLFNQYPDPYRAEATQVAIVGRVSRRRKARIATATFNVTRPAAGGGAAPPAVDEPGEDAPEDAPEDEWGEMADLVRSVVQDSAGGSERAAGAALDPYSDSPPDTSPVAAQLQGDDAAVPPVDLRRDVGNASAPAARGGGGSSAPPPQDDGEEGQEEEGQVQGREGDEMQGGELDPGREASIADGAVRAARAKEPWRGGGWGAQGGEDPAPPPPDLLPQGSPPPGMPPAHAFAPTVRRHVAGGAQDAGPPDEAPPWLAALEDDADPTIQELSKDLDGPPPSPQDQGQRGGKRAKSTKRAHAARSKRHSRPAGASHERHSKGPAGPSRRLLSEAGSLASDIGPAAMAVDARPARRGSPASRRLLDEFASSLRFVDSLMNAAYGPSDGRQVMAHMPHLVDREVVESMQAKWPEEFSETGQRRFRSGRDMQFAFTYFYYLMSEPATFDTERFWGERLDLDGDGALNENEIRTLAQYLELDTDAVGVARLHYLLVEDPPCAFELNATKLEAIVRSGQADVFMRAHPVTFNQFQLCKPMVSALPSHVPPGMRYKFEAGDSREAKFYMLRRNASVVQTALDRMRTQRYKFICLNDDMNEQDQEAEAVSAVVREFLDFLYPTPSSFEVQPAWWGGAPTALTGLHHPPVPWRVLAVVAALVVAACSYWAVTQRKRAEHAMLHRTPEGYRHMTVV